MMRKQKPVRRHLRLEALEDRRCPSSLPAAAPPAHTTGVRPEDEGDELGRSVPLEDAVQAALPHVAAGFADRPLIESLRG